MPEFSKDDAVLVPGVVRGVHHFAGDPQGPAVYHVEMAHADLYEEPPEVIVDEADLVAADRIIGSTAQVTDLAMRPEHVDIQLRHPIIPVLADALYQIIKDIDAPNYVEFELVAGPTDAPERLAMTLQRVAGKTPHALRKEAEAEVARLRAIILDVLRDVCNASPTDVAGALCIDRAQCQSLIGRLSAALQQPNKEV